MPEIARLTGNREWIDLDFVERERTPEPAMALGIQSHVAGLSLSNTVDLLDDSGMPENRPVTARHGRMDRRADSETERPPGE